MKRIRSALTLGSLRHSKPALGIFYVAMIALSVFLAGCGLFSDEQSGTKIDQALLEKKVDSRLWPLVDGQGNAQPTPEQMEQSGLLFSEHGVSVEIVVTQEQSMEMIREKILQGGGAVTASFEKRLYGFLPAAILGEIALLEEVWAITVAGVEAHPLQDPPETKAKEPLAK